MLGRLFTFLLTPLYSNYLSPTDNGVLAYMFSLIVVAQFLYALGMEAAYFRFFDKDNETRNKQVYTTALFVIVGAGVIFTLLIQIFAVPVSNILIGNDYPNAVHILQVVALIPVFDSVIVIPYGRLRMLRQIKRFAITRFLLIVLAVILNAYFVIFTSMGVLGVFLGQLISCVIGVIIFLPEILKMLDLRINWTLVRDMLKFGLPTLPSNLSAIALQVADRPIMKLFVSNAEIGIYQINAKLAVPMLMFVTVFDYAWKPFFLSNYKDKESPAMFGKVLTYYVIAGTLVWVAVSYAMDYIVRIPLWHGRYFIHPDYWNGLYIVPLLLLGYMLNGVTTNFAAVFHIDMKTKYLPVAVGISAVCSIALNFILLPLIGITGAALSLVFSYLVGAILMKYMQRKANYQIKYEWRKITFLAITSIILVALGQFMTNKISLLVGGIIKTILFITFVLLLKKQGYFKKT